MYHSSLGLRVIKKKVGLGFRFSCVGFRVHGLGFGFQGFGTGNYLPAAAEEGEVPLCGGGVPALLTRLMANRDILRYREAL